MVARLILKERATGLRLDPDEIILKEATGERGQYLCQ
jgi:hypothetical protein